MHAPPPTYTELHHVIPQAWQHGWQPATAPFPGTGQDGRPLWDDRTVPLCRTGHGNVHHWIVAIMKRLAAESPADPLTDPGLVSRAASDVRTAVKRPTPKPNIADFDIAQQAPIRFVQAGGDLRTLIDAGEYGEI